VCDALGANLWAGLAVVGVGLLAAVQATRTRPFAVRLAALAVTGAVAGAVYLGLDPACLHGPMGGVDPRIKPIWMDQVQEMRPLLSQFWIRRSDYVVHTVVLSALGLVAWLWLGAHKQGRTPAWLLLGACAAAGFVAALEAERMSSYANWFALPLVAVALGDLATRYFKGSLIPVILAVAVLGDPAVVAVMSVVPGWVTPAEKADPRKTEPADRCIETAALRPLAKLSSGLVLGEIDLGPRILAQTDDPIVAAPYHRMSWGILAAHHVLAAPPGEDEQATRALGAAYVVTCPARIAQANHTGLGPRSLQIRLDHRQTPPWLESLSAPSDPLQIYRVRPGR
jgi:hypothetical protein